MYLSFALCLNLYVGQIKLGEKWERGEYKNNGNEIGSHDKHKPLNYLAIGFFPYKLKVKRKGAKI